MIRNLFLPQKIGDYYLFKKRVVSFTITQHAIHALCITLHAQTKILNNVLSEPIAYDQYETADLAIITAIKKILIKIGSYNELLIVMDSSYAVFKELTIPLLDEEKISQIIGFELENYLPFPTQNAVFDFIITSQNTEKQTSDIIAVALQKEKVDYYVQLFTEAEIYVDIFCIDAFSIYDLYLTTASTINLEKASLLVITDNEKTTTVYIEGNKLKKIRILQENPSFQNDAWWKALTFTFESCVENWNGEKEIIFYGNYSQEYITKAKLIFSSPCTHISVETIAHKLNLLGITAEQNSLVANLAACLDLPITHRFNLKPSTHATETTTKMIRTYSTTIILMVLMYALFGIHAFMQIKKFSNASEIIKTSIMKDLKAALPSLKATSPSEAIRKAKAEITKEEDIWFAFSSQTRHSFLTYLFDLSTTIDREILGLHLKKMTFNKNGITLDGNVRSFDAVEELLKQLRNTNLFTQVPNLQKTEFSLPLTLINQEER